MRGSYEENRPENNCWMVPSNINLKNSLREQKKYLKADLTEKTDNTS